MKFSRFLVAALVLSAAIAAERKLGAVTSRRAVAVEARRARFSDFPTAVGRWRVERSDLTARQLDLLRADDYLRADFGATDSTETLSVYVGYYKNADTATRHPPTICYPGAGWIQSYDGSTALRPGAGKTLKVKATVFDRGAEKQLVVYWYSMPGYEGADTARQKLAALKRIVAGKAPAGAAKVQIAVPIDTTRKAAEKRLEVFLSALLPELERFMPRDIEKGK